MRKKGETGETGVWFTSLGLGLSLFMIAFLLIVILKNGLHAFWPRNVYLVQLKEASDAGINGKLHFAGEVVRKQTKSRSHFDEAQDASSGEAVHHQEWQFFIGNKDTYGMNFHFLDEKEVQKLSLPKNLIRIERYEYGPAFGYPKGMVMSDGTRMASDDPEFFSKLDELIQQTQKRRKEVQRIESVQIREVSERIHALQIRQRQLSQETGVSASKLEAQQKGLDEARAELEKRYEDFAARARELRSQQDKNLLEIELPTGEARTIPLGQVVECYFPNQLNLPAKSVKFLKNLFQFVSQEPREANTEGGVFPAIFGTFVMTLIMSVAVMPFGVIAAIYLREYAKQGLFVRMVRISINNLAGVPSIVFGIFGLGFFVYLVGGTIDKLFFSHYLPTPTFGTGGVLWASLTLALMTVPVVVVATEEALAAVPRGAREASLACGASKWQTIRSVVLPASAPGILTGLVLAMARGAGEVAPLMLVGVVKLAPTLPVDGVFPYFHLERKFMHLGFHIYDLGFQSPDSEAAKPMVFATTLLLIALVILLNSTAIIVRNRLRKRYATSAF